MASQVIRRQFHCHAQQLKFGFPCPYRYACLPEMVALFIFSSGSFLLDVCKVSHEGLTPWNLMKGQHPPLYWNKNTAVGLSWKALCCHLVLSFLVSSFNSSLLSAHSRL